MENNNNIFDYYYISSKDKQYDFETDTNFSIKFDSGTYQAYHLESLTIPHTFYNIRTPFNNFKFRFNNVLNNIVIPVGNYDIIDLITNIETQCNNLGLVVFNITFNNINNKVTIQTNNNIDLIFDDNTLFRELGFNKSSYLNNILFTSQNIVNLTSGSVLHVLSNKLTSNRSQVHNSDNRLINVIARLSLHDTTFGSIKHHEGLINSIRSVNLHVNESVDFSLLDEFYRNIDLNGYHWYIKLKLYKSIDNIINM